MIPRVVAGASRLGFVLPDLLIGRSRKERELRALDSLLDAGYSAFDLAASYQLGGTERLFGEWMASRGVRDRLFLVGKGGHPYPGLRPNRITADALASDLQASLRRLRTGHLDLYLLHRDFPQAPLEPIVRMLGAALRQGQIRSWGVSNWTVPRIQALQGAASAEGLPPMAVSSPHFSLLEWARPPWTGSVSIAGRAGREARAFHARTRLPVLAWSPLGAGYLVSDATDGCYGSPTNAARRERARAIARERGWTVAQVALAYLFSQPFPVSAVVAASTGAKMRENLAAAELRLSPGEVEALEA